jgi:hypothetical protein
VQWFEQIQFFMRIERDMICSSFIDRSRTFWIPVAVVVILIFWGCFKKVLKLFWDCFLHGKIMIDAMVWIDSSFDKNWKRDLFFVRQWIWNFLNSNSNYLISNFWAWIVIFFKKKLKWQLISHVKRLVNTLEKFKYYFEYFFQHVSLCFLMCTKSKILNS